MDRVTRRKPRNYKGLHPIPPKTARRELSETERAFIAGACMSGNLSHNDALHFFDNNRCSKSTITRTTQHVKKVAEEYGCKITDPRCFQNLPGRGGIHKVTEDHKKLIIAITTQDRSHREKESWQAIDDGDYSGVLPNLSISTLENIMYEAGYSRRKPGWKPPLTPAQERERYQWALTHNPDRDHEYDNNGFNFREVVFTDETPARVGELRGMIRAWCKEDEIYDDDVRKDRKQQGAALQFFGAFRYNHKGPCHVYYHETMEEIEAGEKALEWENKVARAQSNSSQMTARAALNVLNEADVNLRRSTRKLQHIKKDDYHRGIRTRGGVDGFRHREGALKKVVPWIKELQHQGIICKLLEDGAPAHESRIANDYLTVERVEKIAWAGHSPDVNASEHAWPFIRKHVTKNYTQSRTEQQCERQWRASWDALPIGKINKWVDGIPEVVRRIIRSHGKNNFHG